MYLKMIIFLKIKLMMSALILGVFFALQKYKGHLVDIHSMFLLAKNSWRGCLSLVVLF